MASTRPAIYRTVASKDNNRRGTELRNAQMRGKTQKIINNLLTTTSKLLNIELKMKIGIISFT